MEFDELESFHTVFRLLSMTKAAEKLNLSKTSVSKKIDSFENKIGEKLFKRSTRKIVPTVRGKELFSHVDEILRRIKNLDHLSSKRIKIKVSCNESMAYAFMGELLIDYQLNNPQLDIELVASDYILDFLDDNIDITVRINPNKNSSLIGYKIGDYNLSLVKRVNFEGEFPKSWDELSSFKLLFIEKHWPFFSRLNHREREEIKKNRFFSTNNSILVDKIIKDYNVVGVRSNWSLANKDFELVSKDLIQHCGEIWILRNSKNQYGEELEKLFTYLKKKLSIRPEVCRDFQ